MDDSAKVSRIKVHNQVKKIINDHVQSNGKIANSEEFINNYLSQHSDLSFAPKDLIQSIAKQLLIQDNDSVVKESALSEKVRKVTSLNQAMMNTQKQSLSKRQRPEDSTNSESKEDPSGEKKEDGSAMPEKKRRPASSKSSSSTNSSKPVASLTNPFLAERPNLRFSDLAGLDKVVQEIKELVTYPLEFQDLYRELGVCPPCGILLHGPSGCGKSALAQAIAGETGLNYFKVSGPELIGGTSGESEENIRKVFDAALASSPSILFIDAFEVLAPRRDVSSILSIFSIQNFSSPHDSANQSWHGSQNCRAVVRLH